VEIAKLREDMYKAIKQNDNLLLKLNDINKTPQERELVKKLITTSLLYRQACGTFYLYVENKNKPVALIFNKNEMIPAFLKYQTAQENLINLITTSSIQKSKTITERASSFSLASTIVAIAPFIIWTIVITLVIGYFIFFLQRRKFQINT